MFARATLILIAVVAFSNACVGLKLPSYIKPCKRNDPELNKCAIASGRDAIPFLIKGDPKYRIPPMDPIEVPELKVNHGEGQVGLDLLFKDLKLYGLKDTKIQDIKINLQERKIEVSHTADRFEIITKYEINGKVLILPISGKGDCNITLLDNTMNIVTKYELIKKKDGQNYLNITDVDLKIHFNKANFHLTNLFNGDKFLGDNMNIFLNENWREVADELSPSIIEAIKRIISNILNSITENVPSNEIFLD